MRVCSCSLILVSVLAASGCGGDEQEILLKFLSNPQCSYPPQARARSLLVRVVERNDASVAVLTQHDQCLPVDIPLSPNGIAAYFKQRGIVVSGVNAELQVMLAIFGYGNTSCTPRDPFAICLLSEVVPAKKDALPIASICLPAATPWSLCKTIAHPEINAK